MKKIGLSLCLLTSTATCFAGAMGSTPSANWTGFYIGANGGAGWGDPTMSMTYLQNGQVSSGITWYPTQVHQSFSGALFGGQIGYDYQLQSPLVIGLKYDTDYSQWTARTLSPSGDSSGQLALLTSTQKLNWIGHLLPRLGYLVQDDLLVYGAGGLLFGNIEGTAVQNFYYTSSGVNYLPGTFKINTTGWSAGAGVEWKMLSNWSFAAEYLYNDFGSNTVIANNYALTGTANSSFQNRYTFNTSFQTIALAVNYRC